MNIKTLIFDLGNVIVNIRVDDLSNAFVETKPERERLPITMVSGPSFVNMLSAA